MNLAADGTMSHTISFGDDGVEGRFEITAAGKLVCAMGTYTAEIDPTGVTPAQWADFFRGRVDTLELKTGRITNDGRLLHVFNGGTRTLSMPLDSTLPLAWAIGRLSRASASKCNECSG